MKSIAAAVGGAPLAMGAAMTYRGIKNYQRATEKAYSAMDKQYKLKAYVRREAADYYQKQAEEFDGDNVLGEVWHEVKKVGLALSHGAEAKAITIANRSYKQKLERIGQQLERDAIPQYDVGFQNDEHNRVPGDPITSFQDDRPTFSPQDLPEALANVHMAHVTAKDEETKAQAVSVFRQLYSQWQELNPEDPRAWKKLVMQKKQQAIKRTARSQGAVSVLKTTVRMGMGAAISTGVHKVVELIGSIDGLGDYGGVPVAQAAGLDVNEVHDGHLSSAIEAGSHGFGGSGGGGAEVTELINHSDLNTHADVEVDADDAVETGNVGFGGDNEVRGSVEVHSAQDTVSKVTVHEVVDQPITDSASVTDLVEDTVEPANETAEQLSVSVITIEKGSNLTDALIKDGIFENVSEYSEPGSAEKFVYAVLDHALENDQVTAAHAEMIKQLVRENPEISFAQLWKEHRELFAELDWVDPGEKFTINLPQTDELSTKITDKPTATDEIVKEVNGYYTETQTQVPIFVTPIAEPVNEPFSIILNPETKYLGSIDLTKPVEVTVLSNQIEPAAYTINLEAGDVNQPHPYDVAYRLLDGNKIHMVTHTGRGLIEENGVETKVNAWGEIFRAPIEGKIGGDHLAEAQIGQRITELENEGLQMTFSQNGHQLTFRLEDIKYIPHEEVMQQIDPSIYYEPDRLNLIFCGRSYRDAIRIFNNYYEEMPLELRSLMNGVIWYSAAEGYEVTQAIAKIEPWLAVHDPTAHQEFVKRFHQLAEYRDGYVWGRYVWVFKPVAVR